jgi:hypothetical protein
MQRTAPSVRRGAPRRIRVAIRRVNPWSVLKFSVLFYFCLMLVFVVGLVILYMMVDALGIVTSIEDLLGGMGLGSPPPGDPQGPLIFEFNGAFLFRTVLLIGIISAVLWSALTVFFAFLYNLIADLVGGIEVTLAERR